MPIERPDLSGRPLRLSCERRMAAPPAAFYTAWPQALELLDRAFPAAG